MQILHFQLMAHLCKKTDIGQIIAIDIEVSRRIVFHKKVLAEQDRNTTVWLHTPYAV